MSNAYLWKPSVGPMHQRPGHWNGQWQYWSTDGTHLGRVKHAPALAASWTHRIWLHVLARV